jgi:VIT1/CCC1 family predicted Fe2+/Mn2+ transporter
MINFRNISFGSSSAVITSLAIIIGLSNTINPKVNVITALLIIAIADNVSDSFGIHVHQESECRKPKEVRRVTIDNFIARFLITIVFVLFIFFLPIDYAIILSVIVGLSIIIILSYSIAKRQKINPYREILKHLALAIIVMFIGLILRSLLSHFASKLVK